MKSKLLQFKFRWAEQLIYEGIIEAESKEEAENIFNERRPQDENQVDYLYYDGGSPYTVLEMDLVSDNNYECDLCRKITADCETIQVYGMDCDACKECVQKAETYYIKDHGIR